MDPLAQHHTAGLIELTPPAAPGAGETITLLGDLSRLASGMPLGEDIPAARRLGGRPLLVPAPAPSVPRANVRRLGLELAQACAKLRARLRSRTPAPEADS